jgi:CIC family chloride channel protein
MNKPEINISIFRDFARLAFTSALIGVSVGLAFTALMYFYQFVQTLSIDATSLGWVAVIIVPTIGILVAFFLVKSFGTSKETGGGSHRLLEAYHYHGGYISATDTIIDPVASAITIGTGGSAGFEGPSLLLGGGIGSLIARRFKPTPEELKTLLLSGAAAGISAVFKAPLTGILFALELPYKRDITRRALIPATVASLTSYLISITFFGAESIFPQSQGESVSLLLIGHSFVIGLITAVAGVAFVEALKWMKRGVGRLDLRYYAPLVGGLMIGVTGLFLPQVQGVGYPTIASLASSPTSFPMLLLLALAVFKVLLTVVTLRTGGSGGLFTPTIFVGAAIGAIYCSFFPSLNSVTIVMASMAALLAATNKTLLTSVAFVAETSGPATIITTLVAAATSYFFSQGSSFYEDIQPLDEFMEEEEMIGILYHQIEGGVKADALKALKVGDISGEVLSVDESATIGELMEFVKDKSHREYPVVNSENRLQGTITLEDILIGAEKDKSLKVESLILRKSVVATPETRLDEVIPELMESDFDNVWVVDDYSEMRLLGVVNETDVLKSLLGLV